jgi:tRNA (cmo5U34)-methyltransferase
MDHPDRWTFKNKKVADGFEDHVREQLPWYTMLTDSVEHIARHYIQKNGTVYDIGASTGNIGNALSKTIEERTAKIISIEPSEEMAKIYNGPQKENLIVDDAENVEFENFDFASLFLVYMFMPPKNRQELIKRLREKCNKGGAIIIVDRAEASSGYLATVMWRLTLQNKILSGASADDIIKKEISLAGVQRPIYNNELGDDAFLWFKFGDWAGWVIEK